MRLKMNEKHLTSSHKRILKGFLEQLYIKIYHVMKLLIISMINLNHLI